MRPLRTSLSVAAVALAVSLAGCSTAAMSSTSTSSAAVSSTQQVVSASTISEDTHFDSDDLTWDAASEVAVTLSDGGSKASTGVTVDGNTVTISAAGTYRLSGSLTDGKIVVAAGDSDTVRIILDGVQLGNSTGSPFVV